MGVLPTCPNCKASVASPERVYKVTVEPEQGERGITARDVGMFRCQRCDLTFPRVLAKKHYLLVPESEFTRINNENEAFKKKVGALETRIEAMQKEKDQRVESLREELRKSMIASLESELGQLEKHVKYLKTERDRMEKEIEEV